MVDWGRRWPNFSPGEVLSPYGLKRWEGKGILLIQPHALDFLQNFRNFIGKPLLVNHRGLSFRGYRSCFENMRAGGVEGSFHLQGLAFDVSVDGVDPKDLYEEAVRFGWMGVGLYPSFVHMDLGGRKEQTLWERL